MSVIYGYAKRKRVADGTEFYVYNVKGAPRGVVSSTGKISIRTPFMSIPTQDSDPELLKAAVGMEVPGSIERVEVEPYEFTNAAGEKLTGTHRWVFVLPNQEVKVATKVATEIANAEVVEEFNS